MKYCILLILVVSLLGCNEPAFRKDSSFEIPAAGQTVDHVEKTFGHPMFVKKRNNISEAHYMLEGNFRITDDIVGYQVFYTDGVVDRVFPILGGS